MFVHWAHWECKLLSDLHRCFQVFKVIHQLVDSEEDILMVNEHLSLFHNIWLGSFLRLHNVGGGCVKVTRVQF